MPSSFKPGQLVWARLEGFPPWPASVIEPNEEHLHRLGVDTVESNECIVLFFNDGDQYQKMSTSALKPYDPRKAEKYYQAARKSYRTQLRGAIKQANDEYELLRESAPSSARLSTASKKRPRSDEAANKSNPPKAKVRKRHPFWSRLVLVGPRYAPYPRSDVVKSSDTPPNKTAKPVSPLIQDIPTVVNPSRCTPQHSKNNKSIDKPASRGHSPPPLALPSRDNEIDIHVQYTPQPSNTVIPSSSHPPAHDRARASSSFEPGELVWVRSACLPTWPAVVIQSTKQHLQELKVDSLQSDERLLNFFNYSDKLQKISTTKLEPYDPQKGKEHYKAAPGPFKRQLQGATKQAYDKYCFRNEYISPSAPLRIQWHGRDYVLQRMS